MRRNTLLVKLLASSVLVALCSITATAWLTARTTSGDIDRQRGQALSDDARIYDALLGYAARNARWDGVAATVATLARQTGRTITLTTQDGGRIAGAAQPSGTPTAVVDPLAVDPLLKPNARADRIDPRAAGPFALPARERERLRGLADRAVTCLRTYGFAASVGTSLTGRPRLDLEGDDAKQIAASACSARELDRRTATERKALARLETLLRGCLARRGIDGISLRPDLSWTWTGPTVMDGNRTRIVNSCLVASRREQLIASVAPAALLYIETSPPGIEVSRLAGVTALVLVLTVGVSVVLASRLVGPVRALTAAANRMRAGDSAATVDVTAGGEIGDLATAFNAMAEHSRRMQDQRKAMVSDIAHELRTPLSNIRGWLEAAEDGVAAMDAELMARLGKESLLLQHIIDDLQDLAVADAGGLRLHPELMDVGDLLDQVAAAHQAPGISLTTASPSIVVDADPVRLRQAVGNLVGNALRHTPPGGSVRLAARAEGSLVVIEVADTGVGIAAGDLPYVFDRFWRADKSRSRKGGGSGLGLAIVRSIITAHGGTAAVTSVLGQGSTFTLRLPFTRISAVPRSPAATAPPP